MRKGGGGRTSSEITFVKTPDGVRIPFEVSGQGDVLVYVRGWITHLELQRLDPVIDSFFSVLEQHRRVVRYDTRGNGLADRTSPNGFGLDCLIQDLETVVAAVTVDDEPIELWGSTYGGPIAISFAAAHPDRVRRLVLDGTYARGGEILAQGSVDQMNQWLDLARTQPDIVYSSFSYMTDPDPEIGHAERIARVKRSIRPEEFVALYRTAFEVDVQDLLELVAVPTLVVHRNGSRAVPVQLGRNLAADLPSARFVGLKGEAQNLWEEDASAALEVIGDFLGFPAPSEVDQPVEARPVTGESTTVMFTDIVASTEMTNRLGDAGAQEVVRAHNRLVRRALGRNHGREIKHTGDGIMASFRSASSALAAAIEIQRATEALDENGAAPPLSLRVGLNSGEPIAEEEDLYGVVVQLAARACAAAPPGGILVTPVVRSLVLGKDYRFVGAGEFDLKGIPEPVPLYALIVGVDAGSG